MLKHRFITGFSIGGAVLAILFLLPAWTHLILLTTIFLVAQFEFKGLVKHGGYCYDLWPALICGLLYLGFSVAESPAFAPNEISKIQLGSVTPSAAMFVITPIVLLICAIFRRKTERALEGFALSFSGFWYTAVLLAFLTQIAFAWPTHTLLGDVNYTGRVAILVVVLLVKFSDIGAFTIGILFGQHGRNRLIPEISPKKTIEGLFGGYLFPLIISCIMWGLASAFWNGQLCSMQYPLVHAIIFPIILTTTGVLGDLAESLFKRSVDIKDSSSIFPGMGGIFDILDSLIFSAPIAYLYIVTFLK